MFRFINISLVDLRSILATLDMQQLNMIFMTKISTRAISSSLNKNNNNLELQHTYCISCPQEINIKQHRETLNQHGRNRIQKFVPRFLDFASLSLFSCRFSWSSNRFYVFTMTRVLRVWLYAVFLFDRAWSSWYVHNVHRYPSSFLFSHAIVSHALAINRYQNEE